jgi:hypothetical protein
MQKSVKHFFLTIRKNSVYSILLLLSIYSSFAFSQETSTPKMNYAITPLTTGDGVSEGEASLITDRLRMEIFQTGMVEIMEREQMQQVLQEQGFQNSGVCDEEACLVQMGQLLGVERMISGSLGRLGKSMYMLNLRIIDVETGKLIAVESADARGGIENLVDLLPEISQKLLKAHKSGARTSQPPTPQNSLATSLPASTPSLAANTKEKTLVSPSSSARNVRFSWGLGATLHIFNESQLFDNSQNPSLNLSSNLFIHIQDRFHIEMGITAENYTLSPRYANGVVTYQLNNSPETFNNGNLHLDVETSAIATHLSGGLSFTPFHWLGLHLSGGLIIQDFQLDVYMEMPDLDVTPISNPYGEDSFTVFGALTGCQLEILPQSRFSVIVSSSYLWASEEVRFSDGYNQWREQFILSEPDELGSFDISGLLAGISLRWNWK